MKNPSTLIRVLLLLGVVSSCGCNLASKYEDASSDPAYRSYVGAQFVTKVEMHLSGVNLPPGYGNTVDVYKLNPVHPGWSGPELITRTTLPAGTVIQVQSIHRCTNCLGRRFEAKIQIPDSHTQFDLPIYINVLHLAPEFARKVEEPQARAD